MNDEMVRDRQEAFAAAEASINRNVPGTRLLAGMATRLGYESEAAFSRAFKRFLGFPPGAVRRAKSDRPAQAAYLHS